ncbi:MAG: hypothetical protein ABIO60_10280 [Aquaticitalea sp.]
MFFRICKITLFSLLIFSMSATAQSNNDAEKQRAEYEKKVKEELDERIHLFTTDLKVDDFQKEIINQKLHAYYEERKKIYLDTSLKYFERDEQLNTIKLSYFSDIKEMISEDTMAEIQSFISDTGTTYKDQKRKEKKKNKKKKD